ncbi:tRNA threonylcarbamoyladenosine dehydratase [Lautropia mirabilis]|uniref:tRNA threonylcarbamoyladenosine dehydratase n=1 Tax=Lautropia mirabilis TaxID=47671 RepID=UPI00288A5691|nr:tRNA threonylcarbamoyladenosine dehydratase [Lautropia mirabilis]
MTDRRFASVARVYGEAGCQRLWQSHVVVVGIGGVGSWAAEALVRSGVGRLTLIDLDHVAESNINRQVHALTSTLGAAKVEVMAQRIRDISPDISVHPVDEFIEPGQEEKLIPADADLVIDAIDAVAAKASLIAWCVANDKPVIACGAAGGRTDPLQLRVEDLSRTTGDALLSAVRARLRRHHGFPRGDGTAMPSSVSRAETSNVPAHSATQEGEGAPGHVPAQDVQPLRSAQTVPPSRRRRKGDPSRFGVPAIHSPEQIAGTRPKGEGGGMPLACAGYGSLVTVTASMGLAAASQAIAQLLR